MQGQRLVIQAATVITPFEELSDTVIEVVGKRIQRVGPAARSHAKGRRRIAADIVAPGYIDLQVNGAGGEDVSQAGEGGLSRISGALARFGVTGFLPTVITAPASDLTRSLHLLAEAMESSVEGADPLGIHLEGPFINPAKRGAHPVSGVKIPELKFFRKLQDAAAGRIVCLTLAPELPGSLELIEYARERLAIVAMGHSDATYEQALEALHAGCRFAMHTFNGMHDLHQREPGLLGVVLTEPDMRAGVIADGTHVHPALVKLLLKVKGVEGVVLSTDCTSAAGMPDGEHRLGTLTVSVREGICRDREGRLAGSTLTLDRAVRNCVGWTGMRRAEIIRMASYNAARALGISDRKGVIAEGGDADLVLLNERLEVDGTIVGGRVVYRKGQNR
ncbi:MAG: N-acetylglucosamine-6-phosphate deacetylase [Acidobacteria bacterium]|nr:N-acetylglucosamine-6-phosphate deacetylase [Acidobacteriota bacterium]